MNALVSLLVVLAADPVPAPNDVKAGWVAFAVFLALAVAVALLGMSLAKHLRRVRENEEAGVFDRNAADSGPEGHPTPPHRDENG